MAKSIKVKSKKVSTRIQRKALECSDIETAFTTGAMQTVRASWAYSWALLLVSLLMLIMPLLYLSLISAAIYFAVSEWHNGNTYISILLFCLCLFLIKPLFGRKEYPYKEYIIEREQEPIFFSYIDHICKSIGSPTPKRIHLNCELNAGAGFQRGFMSFMKKDLDLHLGLPLIVGLDTKQLTGVLSHEFGHFSQGFGMRAGYIIQRVNMWFARVVYQRDRLDYWLERFSHFLERIHVLIAIFAWCLQILIWCSRKILLLFMYIAYLLSNFLSRQMEFNADRHAMNVVGNSEFINTLKYLPVIDHAQQQAIDHLHQAWLDKRLGDNIPALVYSNIKHLTADKKQRMIKQGMTLNTHLYDSHPSTTDRIRYGMSEISHGIFTLERRPARDLFHNFDDICKAVTLSLYQDAYRIQLSENTLIETSQLIANVEQEAAHKESYNRYFQGQWAYHPLFPLNHHTINGDVAFDKLQRELSKSHERFKQQVDNLAETGKQLDQLDNRIITLQQIYLLSDHGFHFDSEKIGLISSDHQCIGDALNDAQTAHQEQCTALNPIEDILIKRMAITYKMLQHPASDELIEDRAECLAEYRLAREQLISISQHVDLITSLRHHWSVLHELLNIYEDLYTHEEYNNALSQQLALVHEDLSKCQHAFADINYPYEHAVGDISVADYLIEQIPEEDAVGEVYERGEICISHYMLLYHRLLGIIAITGEAMEEACGLPQISNPNDDSDFPE